MTQPKRRALLVFLLTTDSLRASILATSNSTLPTVMPWSANFSVTFS